MLERYVYETRSCCNGGISGQAILVFFDEAVTNVSPRTAPYTDEGEEEKAQAKGRVNGMCFFHAHTTIRKRGVVRVYVGEDRRVYTTQQQLQQKRIAVGHGRDAQPDTKALGQWCAMRSCGGKWRGVEGNRSKKLYSTTTTDLHNCTAVIGLLVL